MLYFKPVLSQFESGSVLQWAGGGMADTLVLGTSAFGRESSSLSWPTNNQHAEDVRNWAQECES
jgi:hypothetical protein